jgi:hypothetical protein
MNLHKLIGAAIVTAAGWVLGIMPADPIIPTDAPAPTVFQPSRYLEMPAEAQTADSEITPLRSLPDASHTPCESVRQAAWAVGWPADQLDKLEEVAWAESRCSAAHNPADPHGGSHGVMQINGYWCTPTQLWPNGYLQVRIGLPGCDALYDLAWNLKAALEVWTVGGWDQWTTA